MLRQSGPSEISALKTHLLKSSVPGLVERNRTGLKPHISANNTNRLKIISETGKVQTDILHITGDIHFAALAWPKWRKDRPGVVLTIHDIRILKEFSGFKRWVIRKFWI